MKMSWTVFLILLLLAGHIASGQVKDTTGLQALYNNAYSKLFDEKNYSGAIELFTRYIAADSNNPDAYLYRGRSYDNVGDYIKALKDYQIAYQKSGENVSLDYFLFMGQYYYSAGNYKASVGYYDTIIVVAGQRKYNYYFERSRSLYKSGDCKRALTDIDTALKLNPQHIGSHIKRGDILDCLGRSKEAVAEYDYVLARDSTNDAALFNRGVAKNGLTDTKGAMADFNRYDKIHPGNKDLYYQRGLAELLIEDFASALKDFNAVIAKDSLYKNIFLRRGLAKAALEQDDEAIADFSKQLRITPGCGECFFNRAMLLLKHEKYSDSYKDIDSAAKYITGDTYEMYKTTVQALAFQKKYAVAESYLNRYAKTATTKEQKYKSLDLWSQYYFAREDTLSVIRVMKGASTLYPGNGEIPYTLAMLIYYYCNGRKSPDRKLINEMVADINQAIKLSPDFGDAYFLRAVIKNSILNQPTSQACPDLLLAKHYGVKDEANAKGLESYIKKCQ